MSTRLPAPTSMFMDPVLEHHFPQIKIGVGRRCEHAENVCYHLSRRATMYIVQISLLS